MATRTSRGLLSAHARRASRSFLASGLAVAFVLLATFVLAVQLAAPAAAHVELENSAPAAGSQVEAEPDAVRLVFSGPVQAEGAEVAVTSDEGTQVSAGEPEVADDTVTQPIGSLPGEGRYTVSYRVVSADGHPVSDSFAFSYAPPGNTSPSPSGTHSPVDGEPTLKATATGAGASASAGDEASGGWPSWWPLAALAVIAVAAGSAAVVRLRRQRT